MFWCRHGDVGGANAAPDADAAPRRLTGEQHQPLAVISQRQQLSGRRRAERQDAITSCLLGGATGSEGAEVFVCLRFFWVKISNVTILQLL